MSFKQAVELYSILPQDLHNIYIYLRTLSISSSCRRNQGIFLCSMVPLLCRNPDRQNLWLVYRNSMIMPSSLMFSGLNLDRLTHFHDYRVGSFSTRASFVPLVEETPNHKRNLRYSDVEGNGGMTERWLTRVICYWRSLLRVVEGRNWRGRKHGRRLRRHLLLERWNDDVSSVLESRWSSSWSIEMKDILQDTR